MNIHAVVREALDRAPCSVRALALEAGVSPRLLRMIRDGDRRLTRETRDALAGALRDREDRCRAAAEALEAADPEPRRDRCAT